MFRCCFFLSSPTNSLNTIDSRIIIVFIVNSIPFGMIESACHSIFDTVRSNDTVSSIMLLHYCWWKSSASEIVQRSVIKLIHFLSVICLIFIFISQEREKKKKNKMKQTNKHNHYNLYPPTYSYFHIARYDCQNVNVPIECVRWQSELPESTLFVCSFYKRNLPLFGLIRRKCFIL